MNRPDEILALDPGAQTGWARAVGGTIVDCGLVHLLDDVPCTAALPPCTNGLVVVEKPVYRHGGTTKADPNDLIALGVRVGRVVEAYLCTANKVETVLPSTWKASVPKQIHVRRIVEALREEELAAIMQRLAPVAVSYRHNVWDAVGLALWKVGRRLL